MTALGPGVRIKSVHQGQWEAHGGGNSDGPTFGSVWTIKKLTRRFFNCGGPWLELHEWPDATWFHGDYFVPLSGNEDISQLTALLDKWNEHTPTREDALVTGKVGAQG